ncbi:phosphoglycerate mutase family, putative [Rhodococcus wratislaviensis]|uniref:Phosphoglycerate mutase family, putative n=1 Tax=Rhodococcus wratislaviensis TaxID=44752 RepID=A0A402C664_RHOWR|nr:phosphoglycerate mutase family, putative [Rhodococcus wratislaviensis]
MLTAPETRTIQTAKELGIIAEPASALRDLDYGRWAGLEMDEIPQDQLLTWLTDPTACLHGGESITDLIDRVRVDITIDLPAPVLTSSR